MNTRVSATGLMQRFHRLSGLLVLSFCFIQQLAHAEPERLTAGRVTEPIKADFSVEKGRRSAKGVDLNKAGAVLENAHRGSAGAEFSLLTPSASPYALPANSGKQTVRVSVPVLGKTKSSTAVYLRRRGDKKSIAMNDLGKEGDFLARDGISGVNVQVDTSGMKPDSCLYYETYIKQGRAEIVSPPLRLCVSSFPIGTAKSNTERPAVFQDGTEAVADEVLLYAMPATSAATIRQLADSINASVVGSILPLNIYQLRLPAPASPNRLSEIVAQLKARAGDVGVSVNMIGKGALNVNDPDFDRLPTDIDSQHGLKLVLEHNQATDANAWDAGGIGTGNGNGVTVVVLDTGIELAHPDFDTDWSCGCVASPCPPPGTCYDTAIGATPAGHGTQVAGIIAARTNNSLGVAGVAFGSNIHAIRMTGFTVLDMQNGFNTAAGYIGMNGNAKIINASFSGQWTPNAIYGPSLQGLCTAIDSAVLNSGVPKAVVVNAAGNNGTDGNFYPARCNDSSSPYHATLTRKDLFITVSNSTSVVTSDCGNVSVDQRCAAANPGNPNLLGSNYGAWVDIAAPGSKIRSTTINGGYTSAANITTGTSFSAPLVSGAAAILASCGVPVGDIETTLRSSANVNVPYPNSVSPAGQTPRLDINRALQAHSPAASALGAAESYTEGLSLDLVNIVIASNLSACATFTATLTLSDSAAGSLSTGASGGAMAKFAGGVWTVSGPIAGVNALLANVTYSPAPGYSSDFNIITSVSDGISTISGTKAMHGIAVNDAPIATNMSAAQSYTEDAPLDLTDIVVTDPDAGATITATLTLSAAAGTLSTATSGGVTSTYNAATRVWGASGPLANVNALLAGVTFIPALNYTSNFSIATSVSDGIAPAVNGTKPMTGIAVNDAPTSVMLTPATASTPENGGSIKVADIAVSDDALGTNSLKVSDTGAFQIIGSELYFNGNADYETKNSYSVTVSVDDTSIGGTPDATQNFTLSIADVNEAPTAVTLTPATASTPENGGSVKVADIAVSDDALGTNSLKVSDTGAFQIIGSELYFNGNADYETKNSYSVTVSVDDMSIGGTPDAMGNFTLSITDVNEAPTAVTLTPATASTPENGGSTKVTDIAVTDDALGTNTLTLSGTDAGDFQIIGSGLYFNGSADYETKNSYSVTVSVDDTSIGGTPDATQNFTLSITDVNEAIPTPFLIYDHKEIGTDAFGNTVARYRFRVGNWSAYPPAMFVASPALPPCGLNTSASRTWVDFYRDSDNSRIYGFCALGSPADLNQIWFGVIPANGVPPAAVYITLTDRQNNIVYKSNVVTIP